MIQEEQSIHLGSCPVVPELDIDSDLLALASSPAACALCVSLTAIKGARSFLRSRVLGFLCAPGHSIPDFLLLNRVSAGFGSLCHPSRQGRNDGAKECVDRLG